MFRRAVNWVVLAALSCTAQASKVELVWDPNPASDLIQAYIVYEHVGKEYVRIETVGTNAIIMPDVAVGRHCYVVTA